MIYSERAVVVVREVCVTAIVVWRDVYMAIKVVYVLALSSDGVGHSNLNSLGIFHTI